MQGSTLIPKSIAPVRRVKVFNEKERIKNEFRKAGSLAAIGKIAGATVLAQDVGGKYPTRPDKTAIFDRYKQTTADIRAAEDQAMMRLKHAFWSEGSKRFQLQEHPRSGQRAKCTGRSSLRWCLDLI